MRDVLAAEDSAVVTKEDKDSGIIFPKGAEGITSELRVIRSESPGMS
jgi:hypothetical protein